MKGFAMWIDEFIWDRLREASARIASGEDDPVISSKEEGRELVNVMKHLDSQRRVDGRQMRELAARWGGHPEYREDAWRPGESFEDLFFAAFRK